MNKNIRLTLAIVVLHSFAIQARTITVAIASNSSLKIAAVKTIFDHAFPEDTIEYSSHKTASLVPEQPIGIDAARQGVYNRLQCLPKEMLEADYVVSIENYIEQSCETQRWYDKGLILFKHAAQEIIITTQPTFVPEEYILHAQRMAQEISPLGYSVTIGKAIQEKICCLSNDGSFSLERYIDPSDWHREHEFGGVSRQQLLQEAIFKALHAQELSSLKSLVVTYPDFPKPGIMFANFLTMVNNPQAFQQSVDLLAERYKNQNIKAIVGLESRGFIHGAALAYKLGVSFVPVRKPGKLPGATFCVSYQKEYGTDTLVIAQDSLKKEQRVIIIDDLIATGGSARAAIELVRLAGGQPVEFVSLLKIPALEEQAQLSIPKFNLLD